MDKTMTGWLVNNCLTCIPNTRTFWHDLLDWIPGLEDKTGHHFGLLAQATAEAAAISPPDYIIRNASWFPPIPGKIRTISLLQDCLGGHRRQQQLEVCNSSDLVVFNSWYMEKEYSDLINVPTKVIPLGTDFEFFTPADVEKDYDVIFVGAANNNPKGFDLVRALIDNTNYHFCLVMKDQYNTNEDRVDVYNRIDHIKLRELYRRSKVCICTSRTETLHLSGIEAAACGVPIVATDVGIYNALRLKRGWGLVSTHDMFINDLRLVVDDHKIFDPRTQFLEYGLDKQSCKKAWLDLVDN